MASFIGYLELPCLGRWEMVDGGVGSWDTAVRGSVVLQWFSGRSVCGMGRQVMFKGRALDAIWA